MRTQVAAASLETFRRLTQAQVERDYVHRGILQRGTVNAPLNAAVAAGLTATASDYMRLAQPVREDNNGDPISGSGTKLRCPFCERTYGYETNLRAHIRQRHQGIRVSCPYCPRTFTRNNTVRRHVQREHRHLASRIPTRFGSTRVLPDPLTAAAAAAAVQQQQVAAAAAAAAVARDQQRPASPSSATATAGSGERAHAQA